MLAAIAEAAGGLDGFLDSCQSVVGIDEEGGVVRHGIGVAVEGFLLVIEGHDP